MKDTNTLDVAARNGNGSTNGHETTSRVGSRLRANGSPSDSESESDSTLRKRFIEALTANQKTLVSLVDVVREMIEEDIERDEAIEWGMDAGLSESYVRATVSRLYSDLVGCVRKTGGGRKGNKGAVGLAERALKEYDGSYTRAKAALLAARRHLEKLEKAEATAKAKETGDKE